MLLIVSHANMLDQLCSSFLASLQQASAQCLPHVRKRKTCVPDWNISANKLQQSGRFWYHVWLDCGCPSTGVVHQIKQNEVLFIKSSGNRCCSSNQAETGVVHQIKWKQELFIKSSGNRCCSSNQAETGGVHQIKRKAKNRYKYEVHCLRRRQLYITCRRIGSALSDARHRDFRKEVRLLRRNTCGGHCNHSSIDELSSNDDIASAFTSKLKQLYSTVHPILLSPTGLVLSWTV